ncbi:MAG TPA: ATP-binding protein, partial [Anaerolineae bacterium]|nr:ATP-binding protein [Anaerolineae bacterium]
ATFQQVYDTLLTALGRSFYIMGLALVVLVAALLAVVSWRLVRRVEALQAALDAERRRKGPVEDRSREMYAALERTLQERAAELERRHDVVVRTEKLASLSRLVGGMAHELNNPLAAIVGEATILRQRCTQPELSRGLAVIEQQATRCAGIIRDLAAFASRELCEVQPLDVRALVEGALSQAALAAPAQQATVVRQYAPELLTVSGNMEQLQQALANVIDNAYQSMAAVPGRLTLRTQRAADGRVHLEVADNGAGIDPALLPYIFDPFYSRRANQPSPKVGLGLSVALGLVQAHGGKIWAESRPGQGMTVFIELPAAAEEKS